MVLRRRVSSPLGKRLTVRRAKTITPIWPWLEENRALIGLALFILGTSVSVFSLYIAIDANTRSRDTANRLTHLSEDSLTQLKTQTDTLSSQTDSLSRQVDEQRQFSGTTARQLDTVIVTLSTEVAHLSEQTSSLFQLVQQGEKQNVFAVEPFGWWRYNNAALHDPTIQAAAHGTIQSSLFAWPAKHNAIAFLTDLGVPLPGLRLGSYRISHAEFHNRNIDFSDFSQSTLTSVLFAPSTSWASMGMGMFGSTFYKSHLLDVTIRSAFLTQADFRETMAIDLRFIRTPLTNANFSKSDLYNVTFETISPSHADFTAATLSEASFMCRDTTESCSLSTPRFRDAHITDSVFSVAEISSADFSRAFILNTSFAQQRLGISSFHGAYIIHSTFIKSALDFFDAREASFSEVNFAGAEIRYADFVGATLSEAAFTGARLRGVTIDQDHIGSLSGARLSGYLYIVIDKQIPVDGGRSPAAPGSWRTCGRTPSKSFSEQTSLFAPICCDSACSFLTLMIAHLKNIMPCLLRAPAKSPPTGREKVSQIPLSWVNNAA